jgi:DNA ligase (NAD+)
MSFPSNNSSTVFGVIGANLTNDDKKRIFQIAASLTEADAEQAMTEVNSAYRAGKPVMPDAVYDALLNAYALKFPENAFFNELEVESDLAEITGKTVKLPEPMLSTNKVYSISALEKWADGVLKCAVELGIDLDTIGFILTPKLDGYAAFDDSVTLYTRGNGVSGTDITRAFKNGLRVLNDLGFTSHRGLGKGEIVANKKYFNEVLSPFYENSRNVIAGVIKEGVIDEILQTALSRSKIVFMPFCNLITHVLKREDLAEGVESAWDFFAENCQYDTDGVVISVNNERIKEMMGSTRHHHRWQVAYKKNTEIHNIVVTGIVDQTSKNGFIIPVVTLEPTLVSGVTICRAAGHNYNSIIELGIGVGAIVEVVRSGLVIPYIQRVIKKADSIVIPTHCPSCDAPTEMDENNKHLLCTNTETCPAQFEKTLKFFFQTMGNCDGFGSKVIEQLVDCGIQSIQAIYELNRSEFKDLIGGKKADNLFDELTASRSRPVEDWRFLAAFSIHSIGKGGCENLLKHHKLSTVFDLTIADIIAIDRFADTSANSLVRSLKNIKPAFDALMAMGFTLEETVIGEVIASPIAGKTIVFTGTMLKGKRDDMEKEAKSLGAKVGKVVSKATTYLVCGTGVGESKTTAAAKNNVSVISEDEYLKLLAA